LNSKTPAGTLRRAFCIAATAELAWRTRPGSLRATQLDQYLTFSVTPKNRGGLGK
jgi:hypothetical protein